MTKARDLASSGVTLTSTTTTADAALARAGGTMTGNLAMGTNLVDGVDVSARDAVLTDTTTKATAALPKAGGAMTGAITTNSTFDGVDIATRDGILSSTTTTATAALNNANSALSREGGAMTGAITTNSTFDGVDVGARNSVLTSTTTTANAALPKAGGAMTGAITTNSTFDGRDVAADGVLATNALPKSGGSMTGALNITNANNLQVKDRGSVLLYNTNDDNYARIRNTTASGNELQFSTNAVAMTINTSGKVGIGETVPLGHLHIKDGDSGMGSVNSNFDKLVLEDSSHSGMTILGGANTHGAIYFGDPNANDVGQIKYQHNNDSFRFATANVERMIIDSSGNVGIGGGSTGYRVHLFGNESMIRMQNTGSGTNGFLDLAVSATVATINANYSSSAIPLRFLTGAAEAMRIDSSRNLLVGKTSNNFALAGSIIRSGGEALFTRAGDLLTLNRLTSDGTAISFRKDGSTVGYVGTYGGDLTIGTGDTGVRFIDSLDCIVPISNSAGTSRDAAIDLGYSSIRYKDLYLSGGVYLGGISAAHKLDDYEEGTWTIGWGAADLTGNTTAFYTKIGNFVYFNFYSSGVNITNSSGNLHFTGLPFTAKNVSSGYSIFNTQHQTLFNDVDVDGGYIAINSTVAYFIKRNTVTGVQAPNGTTKYVMLSGMYQTDS